MDIGGSIMKDLFDEIKVLRVFFADDDDLEKEKLELERLEKEKKEKEKTFSAEEMDKAILRRQSALKGKREAEEKAKALEAKIATLPDEDEFNTLKDNYAAMQNALKELKEKQEAAEVEKIEDEKERERAKLTQEFKKEQEKFEAELNKLRTEITQHNEEKERQAEVSKRYRRQALEGAVANAAAAKAFNPQQIVRLLADDFKYDETDDRWYKEIYDNAGKLKELLAVDEYVGAFLNDPINENLLKADVKGGSGTERGKEKGLKPDTFVKEEPSEEMWKWNEKQGFNIDKKSSAEDIAWLVNTFNRLHKRVKEKE
jgi:DNA repair exonuclease SbcCD ATPase subunit